MSDAFDYHMLANRLDIQPDKLLALETCLRRQYGSDQMMFELRMLRTLRAIQDGTTTLDAAIAEFSSELAQQTAGPP